MKRVAKNGTINPKDVTVPGVFIDKIVVCDDPEVDHRQTHSFYFDPSYCGQLQVPERAPSSRLRSTSASSRPARRVRAFAVAPW